jgi:lipopolysaccharide biosynthesis protein
MAKEYGIYGFAFYHYWFNGKRLLETPLDKMLKTGKPDFPFCYIWANENWTKRWDGEDQDIIIKQLYSFEDDLEHIKFLCENVFPDKRYIRINGKHLFIIYKPELFPDIKHTAEIFRMEARNYNIDLYLCYFENLIESQDPNLIGFDACAEFQPKWGRLPPRVKGPFMLRLLNKLKLLNINYLKQNIFEYDDVVNSMMSIQHKINYTRFPCVCPMWDNLSRRKNRATIFRNSTPALYGKWLQSVIANFNFHSADENLVFINAWNEWAEGNHLEPCKKWGREYLEITREIVMKTNNIDS